MPWWHRINRLLRISHSQAIIRRYFVVNGFDGALTMLGIISGAYASGASDLTLVIGACLGAAVALGVSGVSSAYISEVAERRKALKELEQAMITDLSQSQHAKAARWVPLLIGAVNGLAPLFISLVIVLPLWLASWGVLLPVAPLEAAIYMALLLIFLLGVFLGQVAQTRWWLAGLKSLLIGLVTFGLIWLVGG